MNAEVQADIARLRGVRQEGEELQRIALRLAQYGEQAISVAVLAQALRCARAKARVVDGGGK